MVREVRLGCEMGHGLREQLINNNWNEEIRRTKREEKIKK